MLVAHSADISKFEHLAASQDVIVIAPNYRLGALGWFLHPDLRTNRDSNPEYSGLDGSGNFGLLDIIAALRWVKTNAQVFGGDPENITVFGESAGGFNILGLMVSPLAAGFYHKAIVQSGGLTLLDRQAVSQYEEDGGMPFSSREITNLLLVKNGLAEDRTAAIALQNEMTSEEIAKFLRNQTSRDVLNASGSNTGPSQEHVPFVLGIDSHSYAPTLFGDGLVLPRGEQIRDLLNDPNRFHATPVILGSNRDETKVFNATAWALQMHPGPSEPKIYSRDSEYGSAIWKALAVDELSIRLHTNQSAGVFAYRFDWDDWRTLPGLDLRTLFGASHAVDVPFVFHNFEIIDAGFFVAEDEKRERNYLSEAMMSYWAEFAYTGNPGRGRSGKLPAWEPWSNETDANRVMLLDGGSSGGMNMAKDLVTISILQQALINDGRYSDDPLARCAMYSRLFTGLDFDADQFASLGCD